MQIKTGHKPKSPQCALSRIIPKSFDSEALKRSAWQNLGIIIVQADDPRFDWTERELLKRIGNFLYGERVNNGV